MEPLGTFLNLSWRKQCIGLSLKVVFHFEDTIYFILAVKLVLQSKSAVRNSKQKCIHTILFRLCKENVNTLELPTSSKDKSKNSEKNSNFQCSSHVRPH